MKSTDKERFWRFVKRGPPNKCWIWQGGGDDYGMFWYCGKNVQAHRISYLIAHGSITYQVCHTCDNRKCVNPKHLYDATQSRNIKDAVSRGRMKTLFPTGDKHPNSKIPRRKFPLIKRLCQKHPQHYVGSLFGVSQTCIAKILKK